MDEVAPRIRRTDRPMATPDAGRAGDGRRRAPAIHGQTDDGDLTLGRRIGVLVVLGALGAAIVLAASGVGGGDHATAPLPTPTAQASASAAPNLAPVAPPSDVPIIRPLQDALITSRSVDLRVTVPDMTDTLDGLSLRIYRNTNLLKEVPLRATGKVRVADVPLRRGTNKLTAVLANEGGESPRSAIVTVTVDDQPPKVKVRSPHNGSTLNEDRVRITGVTEPGLTVTARNTTSGSRQAMTAGSAGAFGFDMGLADGRNVINLRTRDTAGNVGSSQLVIVKGDGRPSADLWLSRHQVKRSALPTTLDAKVTVRDADGRPVEGAPVTFSLSPPGQLAVLHEATTKADGIARWSGLRLIKSGTTTGVGTVTARAVLPDGRVVEDVLQFKVR